jgi:two-component system, NarL family, nitrate/nitrite response regulator NarL
MYHILLIDDHAMFREGIALLLHKLEGEVTVQEAGSCEEAFKLFTDNPSLEHSLDLILLDLALPGMGGMEGLMNFRDHYATVPLVVLSATENVVKIRSLFDAGAQGFIPKAFGSDMMLAAIKVVLAGGIFSPYEVLQAQNREETSLAKLSTRQLEVLGLMAEGHPNKTIARRLDISENTVRVHVAAILRLTGAKNRTGAVRIALDSSLFS